MLNTIKNRTSIRTYQKKPLSDKDHQKVMTVLNDIEKQTGPFGHRATFFYVNNEKDDGKQYGTYGFIKHAPAYIGGVIKNSRDAMVDYGFLFEQVILQLTKKNLGTVWLGGTFNRNEFNIDRDSSEIIPAISPVGYLNNRSIREKLIRGFTKANHRLAISKLFFEGKNLKPIDESHPYIKYFKALQLAPSASNKQPWRIIFDHDTFHLYLERTKGYGQSLNFDIQSIDMGIALSHLCLTLKEDQITYKFIKETSIDIKDYEHIISVKIKT